MMRIPLALPARTADRFDNSAGSRLDGAFEHELAARAAAEKLRRRQSELAGKISRKQERAQRLKETRKVAAQKRNERREERRKLQAERQAQILREAEEKAAEEKAAEAKAEEDSQNEKADDAASIKSVASSVVTVVDDAANATTNAGPGKKAELETLKVDTAEEPEIVEATSADDWTVVDASTPDTAGPSQSKSTGFFPSWIQSIFGSSNKISADDTPSHDLEAYMVDPATGHPPIKVPFGHDRLQSGLKKLTKGGGNKGSTWHLYVDMTAGQRVLVDKVIKHARAQSHHQRTCLGIEEFKRDGKPAHYLVFFSLSEPPLPILFKDAIGRAFRFPYERCRTWMVWSARPRESFPLTRCANLAQDMKRLVDNVFAHVETVGPVVLQGKYDLLNLAGEIIPPALWSSSIRPGEQVTMLMWPVGPLAGQPQFPRPNPPPPPGMRAFGPRGPGGVPRPPGHVPVMPPPPPGGLRWWDISRKQHRLTRQEIKDLTVVDFAEEHKRNVETKDNGLGDVLRRLTYVTDRGQSGLAGMKKLWPDDSDTDSSDSSTSGYGSADADDAGSVSSSSSEDLLD